MINANDFETLVVRPALAKLAEAEPRMNSDDAVALLMGTAAQETDLGRWLKQVGGPALGPFSVEPNTAKSIWRHYLARPSKKPIREVIISVVGLGSIDTDIDDGSEYVRADSSELATNLIYSAMMARLVYWPKAEPLPSWDDKIAMGVYWDVHYNANPRVGTPDEFVKSYDTFLRDWRGIND